MMIVATGEGYTLDGSRTLLYNVQVVIFFCAITSINLNEKERRELILYVSEAPLKISYRFVASRPRLCPKSDVEWHFRHWTCSRKMNRRSQR
ncbi:hypothetical protein CPB83DRAFT_864442 [Crepidotus variabilis]|uniref:Uncharacterized protein n=1 Tax=Crepidotus variabilis TaxID=179855 RepID=A0A9P6E4K9_9AGAR|nr:hypothetical protein CPB83DRAFT_864442 [Crepidotus variabilis]